MAIFAIGDTHLSFGTDKPMDVFGISWRDYENRLSENWRASVSPDDAVIIAGDVSWAMNYDELLPDLRFLDALPGRKYIVKGNHDYWFDTMKKNRAFVAEHGLSSIDFIHNECAVVGDTAICGTRGWFSPDRQDTPHDKKIYARELSRLKASLEAAKKTGKRDIIAALHYPPIHYDYECPDIMNMLAGYGVSTCVYGHIHAQGAARAIEGEFFGVDYSLVAADYIGFAPKRIR